MTSYYGSSFRRVSATSSAGDDAGHTPAAMTSYYGATEHVQDPGATEDSPWLAQSRPAEFWSQVDAGIMAAVALGWPQWEFDRRRGITPPRSPFSLEFGKLKYAARIDMFRGTQADDIRNDEWAAILRRLPKYRSWSMRTYGCRLSNESWGNCMEKIVGLAYTVSRNQVNLGAEGGRLVFPSPQASLAWGATWPLWKSLGLTPGEGVARLQEEQRTLLQRVGPPSASALASVVEPGSVA